MKKINKKGINIIILISIILIFVGIKCVNPFSKSEEIGANSGSNLFQNGDGTSSNPYKISTKSDMFLLAELINTYAIDSSDNTPYNSKYYELTNDIDLENDEWTPIGTFLNSMNNGDLNYTFQGNFNGKGYTIKNVKITVDTVPTTYKTKYGLFGGIYSESSSNRAVVTNLEIDKFTFNLTGSTTASSKDIAIGTIAGHMGKNSSIINCIVKNSKITVNSDFVLGNEKMLAIGGIVGDTSNECSENDSGFIAVTGSQMYEIENCYSNVDIKVDDKNWEKDIETSKYYQFNIGGIIGRIRYQKQFPKNCIYTGKITASNAFIGPIYGAARYGSGKTVNQYERLYLGLDDKYVSLASMNNSYFYNYKIVNGEEYNINENYTNFPTILNGGVTAYVLDETLMKSMQGVNRGEYLNSVNEGIELLNSYSGIGSNYSTWYYDDSRGVISFKQSSVEIRKIEKYKYKASVESNYEENTLTYKWYVDDVLQTEKSASITINNKSFSNRVLKVEVYSGTELIGSNITNIEPETLDLKIKTRDEGNKEILYVEIDSTLNVTTTDFTYTWYMQEYGKTEWKILNGNKSEYEVKTANGGDKFKVVATHKSNEDYDREAIHIYGVTVYVNQTESTINGTTYEIGNDDNDGKTPETAVKTIEKAYEILPVDGTEISNLIQIMGGYTQDNTINCTKPATISGDYYGENYEGILYLNKELTIFLSAKTKFKNIVFNGCGNETEGAASTRFIYCQGNDITIDENVEMTNFANATAAVWGLKSSNYPALCLIGGWLNYSSDIPIPNKTCNIIIKSGGYARVIAGGRSEKGSDILGTLEHPFNVNIEIDITNNKVNTYDNDIGLLVGGQADGTCYINNSINLKNGTVGRLVGGNLGYGNVSVDEPTDTFFGSTTINLTGGGVNELFGGSYGRNEPTTFYYGKININIDGATIGTANGTSKNLYGTGAGGTTGYSEYSTAIYKDWAKEKSMKDLNGDSFRLDESKVEINISNGTIYGNVYGAGYGYSLFLKQDKISPDGGTLYGNSTVNITGGTIYGNVYGGGQGTKNYAKEYSERLAQVYGDVTVKISGNPIIVGDIYGGGQGVEGYTGIGEIHGNSKVIIENWKSNKNITTSVYGGGEGSSAILYGKTYVEINNAYINGRVCGGGNAGDVISGTEVKVFGDSNVVKAVYGGGNEANVGSAEQFDNGNGIFANTKVTVENAIIGQISGSSIIAGEVFGGGNYGIVYGNTEATLGSKNIEISTIVGEVFYGGGRGTEGTKTVMGNSNAYIIGLSTVLESYGSTLLGEVKGDVNITFDTFRNKSATNKYENMKGINKATNLKLIESYIYLEGGLVEIENLFIPNKSGMMISENSHISGNFTGGGEIYLQNKVCFTIGKNMYDEDGTNTKTTLSLNPEFVQDQEGDIKEYYSIFGNIYTPYIEVIENDYSSGLGIKSGNSKRYEIYSLNKDDDNPNRYNCTCKSFIATGVIDANNGMKYISTFEEDNGREYYYDNQKDVFYIIVDEATDTGLNLVNATGRNIDSIYYIDQSLVITNYATVANFDIEDKLYYSKFENTKDINILQNGSFTADIDIEYTMIQNAQEEYIDPNGFTNVQRSISFESDGELFAFPVNTSIIMVVEEHDEKHFYSYIVTEQNKNKIYLSEFKDRSGANFSEITDIQSKLTSTEELVTTIKDADEAFRFIVDFSECSQYLKPDWYDLTFNIENMIENAQGQLEDSNVFTKVTTNSVKIESRNYTSNLSADKDSYKENETIKINGNLKLDRISMENKEDLKKDVIVRINLKDNENNCINFPKGAIIKFNGNEYNSVDELCVKIIEELETSGYTKDINFSMDMSNVPKNELLTDGDYTIEFKYLLSENDILISEKPLIIKSVNFSISRYCNYGIRINSITKENGKRDDEIQAITEASDVIKFVNIEYEQGNLPSEMYIVARLYKRDEDNPLEYIDLNATIAEEQNIRADQNVQSKLIFGSRLKNGTYKVVYELTDSEGHVFTKTHVNFVVKRK